MKTPLTILMLGFPDAQLLDITGPLQMFAAANDELQREAYRIQIAAPEAGPFATSSGIQLVADLSFAQINARRLSRVHTLLVSGGSKGVTAELDRGEITRIVQRAVGRTPRISSICTGAYFLAAAGVLDGRRAATHWNSVAGLQRFRPAVQVDTDAIHVEDRGVWTSAGVTAGLDLALAMIEADHDRKLALAIARRHVVFRIRPGGQSQFSPDLAAQATGNARIARLAELIIKHPARDWRAETLASEAGTSLRSLSRLFRDAMRVSPAEFVERARIDLARRQLLESDVLIETVATSCGFGSLRRMDRAFSRAMAVTPRDFRARFQSAGQHGSKA